MPSGAQSNIANTAVRMFLQDMGVAYDQDRGLEPYAKRRHFAGLQEFFDNRCCYCGVEFGPGNPAVEDHLIPINKTDLGLHAWGNIVPACRDCNARKQGGDWRDFIVQRAEADAAERHAKIREFVSHHRYAPQVDLRKIAAELYDEVGVIATTLIRAKIKRLREDL